MVTRHWVAARMLENREVVGKDFLDNLYLILPLFEFRVDDPVREAFTADTDTLKYTVTLQLMQHQGGVNQAWSG